MFLLAFPASPKFQPPKLAQSAVQIFPLLASSGESTTTPAGPVPSQFVQRVTQEPILSAMASFVVAADAGIVTCASRNTKRAWDMSIGKVGRQPDGR